VAVHVEVVVVALLHVVQVGHLREHRAQEPQAVRQLEPSENTGRDDETAQLGEHPLPGGIAGARRRRAGQALRFSVGGEAELGGQASEPQRPKRIALVCLRAEHAQRARSEVGPPSEGVDGVAARNRAGDLVHGKVAPAEIFLDRLPLERREVVHPRRRSLDNAPGAERLGEGEHRPPNGRGERPRRGLWIPGDRHVHVADRPPEQLVADCPAHHPRVGAREDLGEAHRTCSRRTRGERPQVIS
jgi:hypothetical protein